MIEQTRNRLRAGRAETLTLAFALDDAHPHDAAALATSFLETAEAPLPWFDPFSEAEADARLFATAAPVHQLAAVVAAGLHRLSHSALPRGVAKRALIAIWAKLSDRDRRAFLARIDPDGRFRGGPTR